MRQMTAVSVSQLSVLQASLSKANLSKASANCFTEFDTQLGRVTLTSNGDALTGFYFAGQKYFPTAIRCGERDDSLPLFAQAQQQFRQYEQGTLDKFNLPLQFNGTAFQQKVWQALLTIPNGRTLSYGQLACAISAPTAVRAVGAAVGRNPLSVIVPCHRVLGANGSLTGYAGGLSRKQQLLQLEGALARC